MVKFLLSFKLICLQETFTWPCLLQPATIVSFWDEMHAKCLKSKEQKIILKINTEIAELTNQKLNGCYPAVSLYTVWYNISPHPLIAFF